MPGLPPVPVEQWRAHADTQFAALTTDQDAQIADLAAAEQQDALAPVQREQAWTARTQQEDAQIAALAQTEQAERVVPEQDWQARVAREDAQIAQFAQFAQHEQQTSGASFTAQSRAAQATARGPVGAGVEQHRGAVQAAFGDLGPEAVENMLAIMERESGGSASAQKTDEVEDSHGVLQINARAHPDLAQRYDLNDPVQNARAAREIFNAQGYGAWKNASDQLGLLEGRNARPSGAGRQAYSYGAGEDQAGQDASMAGFTKSGPQASPGVEALGQFEQGLPTEDAYSVCGPVAALAFAQANGRNPDLGEARRLAKQVGWTSQGGMNGVANEQKLLAQMGVSSRLDTNPDFGVIAADAAAGNPVIISTGVHYYFVNGYDKQTGQLHVGKTGEARRGGGSWMSAQQIATLDGGINGALFVDNPQSPTPSVGAGATPDLSEPPLNDQEPQAAELTGRYRRGVEAGASPDGPLVPAWAVPNPGAPSDDTGAPFPTAESVGRAAVGAFDAGGDVLVGAIEQANTDRSTFIHGTPEEQAARDARIAAGGPQVTAEEMNRSVERGLPFALAMTGEPIANAGATVAGKVAGAVVPSIRTAAATAAEVARIRLDKFPEGVRDVIQQAATDGAFWMKQRRGVIPDAAAERMADDLGRSVDQLIAGGKAGKAHNTEETRALRNAVTGQAMLLNDLTAAIAKAPHDATPAMIAESIAQGMKLNDLSRIAEGARAEAGRTLRAYSAHARDSIANPGGAVERIYKAVGGAEQANKAVAEYQKLLADGGDVFAQAAFWARKEAPPVGFNDWWELLRKNAMLSGPRTILVNLLSGGTEVPWKLATDAVMSTVRGHPGEIVPEARAMWAGLQRGLKPAMETIAKGITEEQALAGDVPRSVSARVSNPLAKGVARALEAPMTVAQATDEVMLSVGRSMHVAREAAIQANKEGLRGTAWTERVADLIETPTPSALKRAEIAANDMTFKGDMGDLGQLLNKAQQYKIVGPAIIPFLRTVYHITARGIDRSPLGLVGTGIDVARGVYRGGKDLPKGVRPLGPRLTDNVLGTAASAWMYGQAMEGNISGAGPDDPEKLKMLEAQGWGRYSVNVGGRWVSYTNWGPVAIPLSLMAGAAEAQTYAKPGATTGDKVLDAFGRSAKVLTEQNYLQGIGAVYKAINDPERFGQQWLSQYVQTLVPMGAAINTVGQMTDPLIRQPGKGDIGQALAGRFPGLREGLPAKQDVLGRDVTNEQQGLGALIPLRSSEGRPDQVLQVLLDNGADIGAPPKEVKSVPLSPADQQRHQEIAGGLIADTVGKITADPRFAALPRETRQKILQGAVERARTAAGGILFGELGSAELSRRYREKATAGASR